MSGNKTDNGVLEVGTDEIRVSYSEDTPGQYVDAFIKEQEKAFHEAKNKVKKNFSQVFQNPLKGFPYNEEITVTENPLQEGKYLKYSDLLLKKSRELAQIDKQTKRNPNYSLKALEAINKEIEKEQKKLGITEENLQEGTWSVPDSYKKLYNLQVGFLQNKKQATELNSRKLLVDLYGIFGDDSLYDDVGEYIDTPDPKFDLRDLIVKHAKHLGIKINNSYKITHAPKEWIDNLGKSEDVEEAATIFYMKKGHKSQMVDKKKADKLKKQGWKMVGKEEFEIEERLIEGMPRRGRGNIKKPKGKIVSFVMRKENKEKEAVTENYNNPSFEEFQEASRNMSGSKLTGQEISSYFRKHKVRDKTIRKAVEIALDHGGAMNYAIKQIEKLKRGLSNHKDVKKALEVANFGEHVSEEDVEKFFGFFSEAFTDAQIDKLRKSYAGLKTVDPTSGTGKKLLDFMRGRAEDELIALYKGNINFISLLAASNLISRFKYKSNDILKLKEEKLNEAPVLPSTQAGQIQGDHSIEDGVRKYEEVINKQYQSGRFAKLHKERQSKVVARKASKYYRVENNEMGKAGSIHAFIEISTGDIFKPASFKAPAKGARGNVTDQRYLDYVAKYPDAYYGGHLYK